MLTQQLLLREMWQMLIPASPCRPSRVPAQGSTAKCSCSTGGAAQQYT